MISHLTEDDLVLHYYGEMNGAEEVQASAHLSSCAQCHESYRRLQRVLAAVDDSALVGPELPEHFERTVWARLEPNLPRAERGWSSWLGLSPARLAWVAMLVLLVGAAFVAGRLTPRQPVPATPQTASDDAAKVRERILLIDLDDHLEQSQMVLIELVSAADDKAVNISEERSRAEQLVSANRLYRQTAASTGDAAVADLLDELERVLVDVAASPDQVSGRDLGELQRQIESRSLLFKVRVVSSEVRQRQRAIVQERAGQRSSM
jgi:hypothetical protein